MKIVVANINPIHRSVEATCGQLLGAVIINKPEDLTSERLDIERPDYIFFLHWSTLIPREIFEKFVCVVFHMTDLPYGRGGSPLQNLILRGHKNTKLSAIKVEKGLDTGPIYLKRDLSLEGTANEIFVRAGELMVPMIQEIVEKKLEPRAQSGEPVVFKRRTPAESDIRSVQDVQKLYDFIRMLDGDGYPKAFLETDYFRFEFSGASRGDNGLSADVIITKK